MDVIVFGYFFILAALGLAAVVENWERRRK